MSVVLVVNSGSSSLKYQIIEVDGELTIARGLVERIGEGHGHLEHTGPEGTASFDPHVPDHEAAFAAMLDACDRHGPDLRSANLSAVGHRVVQGGTQFVAPTQIDDGVERAIDDLIPLAPLHNGANLLGIRAARAAFPHLPHVAVFDTAFHRTMPPAAYTYAIDRELAGRNGVRKYGFHGTSHQSASREAAAFLSRPLTEVNSIVLHLGNGASACAVQGGCSVDTSMGMTPLAGLVMGTRSGDIDPAVLVHLHRQAGLGFDELDDLINRRSGLLGLAGANDMRDVLQAAVHGRQDAHLALDVYCHRIRHYVGAYLALLGRVDALVFTGGVGEHAAEIRRRALDGLTSLGFELDLERNAETGGGTRRISRDASRVAVLVIPANEELEIARQTVAAISGT